MTQIAKVHPTEIQKGDRIRTYRKGDRLVWRVEPLRNRNGFKVITLPLGYKEPELTNYRERQEIAFRNSAIALPIVARSHVSKIVEG
jgi:hypothetical protein